MTHPKKASWSAQVFILLSLLIMGLSTTSAHAQGAAIAQNYETTSSGISAGVLVSLVTSGSDTIKPATADNAAELVGVAVSHPILQLSNDIKDSVQVAVGGSAEVLVSDANGTIKTGDKITVSPLTGIGMKAISSGEIVGTAQSALHSVRTVAEHAKGNNGKSILVHVGLIPVAVNVVYYAATSPANSTSAFVPPFLQSFANTLANKPVSPLRVLVGMIALLGGSFAVITMLYVGIRSGITSLGRNPLAASALRRGMVDVLVAALGVFVVTGVIVASVILV